MRTIINYIENEVKAWANMDPNTVQEPQPWIDMHRDAYALALEIAIESTVEDFVDNMDNVSRTIQGNCHRDAFIMAEENIIYHNKELWIYAGWGE